MSRGLLPPDVGPLHPRLKLWMLDRLEPAARPRKRLEHTFTAANQEYAIRHSFPGKPVGFTVLKQDRAGSVYESRPATKFTLFLKGSAAGLKVLLELR